MPYINSHNIKVLLISYSGYPESNSTWIHLDNGLALIANSLLEEGYQVKIYDLQSLSTWEKLYPYEFKEQLFSAQSQFDNVIFNGKSISQKTEDSIIDQLIVLEKSIKQRNFKVVTELSKEIIAKEKEWKPDVLSFKLWAQKSMDEQIHLIKKLKNAFKDSIIVAGGPAVEIFEEYIYELFDGFDALVHCPGEKSLPDLIDAYSKNTDLSNISGIIYKKESKIIKTPKEYPVLKKVLWRSYDDDVYLDYESKLKNIHVESSRGCSHKCNFCIHPKKSGPLKLKSAESFIDELYHLNKTYGFSYFHLADSNPPFSHILNIGNHLIDQNLKYSFMCFQSLRNKMIDFQVSRLKTAGFDWFWIGLESGSTKITGSINKNRNFKIMLNNWKLLKKYDFTITASLITPFPQDDEDTLRSTIKLVKQLQPDILLVYPPIIQPGTKWFTTLSEDKDITEKYLAKIELLKNGFEWHTGNSILPAAFMSSYLGKKIKLSGKNFRSIFNKFKANDILLNKAKQQSLIKFAKKQMNNPLRFKRLYFKAQISVANAIENGNFEKASHAIKEYNDVATLGKLSDFSRHI